MPILRETRLVKITIDAEGEVLTVKHKLTHATVVIDPTQLEKPRSLVVTPGEKSEMVITSEEGAPAVRVVSKIHTARRRHKR